MTSRDFCYWLQGFFELRTRDHDYPNNAITPDQADLIRRHLAMVFKHEIDPSYGGTATQEVLGKIHGLGWSKDQEDSLRKEKDRIETKKQYEQALKEKDARDQNRNDDFRVRC